MNEERFAFRVRQALNQGLTDVSPAACRRLEAARHLALARQKEPVPQAVLNGGRHGLRMPFNARQLGPFLSALALLVGMWLSFYWQSNQYVHHLEKVDSALLADDLPPEAFLDKDLLQWLKDDSSAD